MRLHCMIWLCNGHSRQNEESVNEDVVVVISGSDAKESILGLGSSCQHEPGLTAGYSSQSSGRPFREIRPAECYPVGSPENHMGELAMETLTGKHLQCLCLCGVA